MNDPVQEYLSGAPVPMPSIDDVYEWRMYLVSQQTQAMQVDENLTPSAAFEKLAPEVRREYLAAFPSGEPDEIFAPDDLKEDAAEPVGAN